MGPMPPDDQVDRTRIRAGLVIVSITFLVALVVLLVVENGAAKLIMGLVMVTALVRALLLVRTLRG